MKLEPDFWRGAFAEEGGVAHVGPKYPSQNFTVTSGMIHTHRDVSAVGRRYYA
jgi:hypothetical protein